MSLLHSINQESSSANSNSRVDKLDFMSQWEECQGFTTFFNVACSLFLSFLPFFLSILYSIFLPNILSVKYVYVTPLNNWHVRTFLKIELFVL